MSELKQLYNRAIQKMTDNRQRAIDGGVNCINNSFERFSRYWPGIEKGRYYIVTASSGVLKKDVYLDMKISKHDGLAVQGIYKLLNTINGKFYIGSSKNIYNRLMSHRCKLRNDRHENRYLQSAYNKHGEDAFNIELLATVDDNLLQQEQYFIDDLSPEYNITRHAVRNILSAESRAMISVTLKRRYAEGMLPTRITPVDVYDEDNNKQQFASIKACSVALGINKITIGRVISGKYKQVRGLRIKRKGEYPLPYESKISRQADAIKKETILHDVIADHYLLFESNKNALKFLNTTGMRANHLVKGRYLKAPLKLGELLGYPEEDNQQPSHTKSVKVVWKVQRIEIEDDNQ